MCRAGVIAGADGLLVEVHNDPEHAKCDGPQSLTPDGFSEMMEGLGALLHIEGKKVGRA
jgi:3-deoxy-7-phosphoheptulonate synthase